MPENIEIKARLRADQWAGVRAAALSRASAAPESLRQVDTFYAVPFGRLKLRRLGDAPAELIAYERPDESGPKLSSYVRYSCLDPRSLHEALSRSLGVRGTVVKHREVILVGQTRVHLDEVTGLGTFLELEVVLRPGQSAAEGRAIAADLMAALGVAADALVDSAYIDLLEDRSRAGLAES